MFNLIHKFIYWTLSMQEKLLRKRLGRSMKSSFSNSTSKLVFGKAASLSLNIEKEKKTKKLKHDVAAVLSKYENNPQKLLAFISRSGTKVCKIPHADLILKLIGFEEGFIGELKGIKAFYLTALISILSDKKILSFKTEPMFVLRDLEINPYYMIQQFHKWYAMKLNLPGFDNKSQENFQKFLVSSTDEDIKELNLDEIMGLKEAIARDVEAINFVVELAKATDGSRNAMKKLVAGGASV